MGEQRPTIVALVLHWQGLTETQECLASLSAVEYPALETIVVNNSSDSQVAAAIGRRFPHVQVLNPGRNLGFVEGNNLGIQQALARGAAYVLLLNNDTVVAPDLLDRLLVAWEGPSPVAAAGPTIYYFDRPSAIWSAGGLVDWATGATHMLGLGQTGEPLAQTPHRVDFVTGCTMLIAREALENVGIFDPHYFAYYEEVDWCVRAGRLGYHTIHVPQGRVWHRISPDQRVASPRVAYYMTRNRLLFLRNSQADPWPWLSTVGTQLRTIASWSLKPRWKAQRPQRDAMVRGMLDFFRGQLGRSEVYSPW